MTATAGRRGWRIAAYVACGLVLAALAFLLLARDPIASNSLTLRNLTAEPVRDVVVTFPSRTVRRSELPPGGKLVVFGHTMAGQGEAGMKFGFTYRGRRHEEEYGYLVRMMPPEHCDAGVIGDEVCGACCEARLRVTAMACPGEGSVAAVV